MIGNQIMELWNRTCRDPDAPTSQEVAAFAKAMRSAALDEAAAVPDRIARATAEKWKGEAAWKQPYAGNRVLHIGWDTREAILALKGAKSSAPAHTCEESSECTACDAGAGRADECTWVYNNGRIWSGCGYGPLAINDPNHAGNCCFCGKRMLPASPPDNAKQGG